MKTYLLKSTALHLAIATLYLGYTYFQFVTKKSPDPIGAGLKQWLFFIFHLVITLIVTLGIRNRTTVNNTTIKYKWLIQVGIIIVIMSLYLIVSQQIWDWLWQLR